MLFYLVFTCKNLILVKLNFRVLHPELHVNDVQMIQTHLSIEFLRGQLNINKVIAHSFRPFMMKESIQFVFLKHI